MKRQEEEEEEEGEGEDEEKVRYAPAPWNPVMFKCFHLLELRSSAHKYM